MLREGAPVKPDPSSPNWKPEKKVSVSNTGADTGFYRRGPSYRPLYSDPRRQSTVGVSRDILSWKNGNLCILRPSQHVMTSYFVLF